MYYVYDERMVATTKSFSPSSRKPGIVVADWEMQWPKLKEHYRRQVTPATRDELCLAHDPAYVDGVMNCELPNGFHNHDPEVAASLPWTVGAMLSAARLAVKSQVPVCAPVSGFHHAHHDHGGGYCTFNGLMVAAIDAIQSDAVDAVWIVDCDYHYGDGTDHILATLPKSLRKRIHHFTAGKKLHRPAQANDAISFAYQAAYCAKQGAANLDDMGIKMDHKRKLVLYQAGADQHIDDPLGGILTTEQLKYRDHAFFKVINAYGIPCAWNLAGGYQQEPDGSIPKVLEVHRNTMQAVLETM